LKVRQVIFLLTALCKIDGSDLLLLQHLLLLLPAAEVDASAAEALAVVLVQNMKR
jgi:hypothetical protein